MKLIIEELYYKMNYDLLTGADLAFIGDAYFELYIRNYVLHKGRKKKYI